MQISYACAGRTFGSEIHFYPHYFSIFLTFQKIEMCLLRYGPVHLFSIGNGRIQMGDRRCGPLLPENDKLLYVSLKYWFELSREARNEGVQLLFEGGPYGRL